MGPEADEVLKTFGLSTESSKLFDTVLQKFDEYFKPKVNIIRLRRIFQRRMHETNESEEAYIRALYLYAGRLQFWRAETRAD